jgi:hypothetical protein
MKRIQAGGRTQTLKRAYISHPLRGGMSRECYDVSAIVRNKEKADTICRSVVRDFPDVLPLSPINAFSFFSVFDEDDLAIKACLRLLELADELWVFGDWERSEGCRKEIAKAEELCIPIIYKGCE